MSTGTDKINGWISRISAGDEMLRKSAKSVFEENSDKIVELTKERISTGYGMDGTLIHPTYEEDLKPNGFFKSTETARAYQRMKMYRFGVQPTKGINLRMTGELYDNMYVDIDDEGALTTSNYVGHSLNAAWYMRDIDTINRNGAFKFFPSWVMYYFGDDIVSRIIQKIKG